MNQQAIMAIMLILTFPGRLMWITHGVTPKETKTASYIHTIRLSGDISLTPKWKIGVNTGYDFVAKEFSTTNISIHRDLHCWEMRFSVVPFGDRRSYSFTINAKSAILRDVK